MSESYIEVVDVLTYLRNEASELSVTFEGDKVSYSTTVTAMNARHRIMVLESYTPILPFGLKAGKPVTITSETLGRKITLESKFIEPVVPDFSLGYEVIIPESLGTALPRGALRFMLDEIRNGVRITLKGDENQTVSGFVKNISSSGVGMKTEAELPRFLTRYLSEDKHIVDCQISLDNSKEIACKMEIRNIQNMISGEPGTYIGGRMLGINQKDNRLLTNFINELQQIHLEAVAA